MMYGRRLLLVGLVLVFVPALLARRNRQDKDVDGEGKHSRCSNWSYGPCVIKNNAPCGIGKKLATTSDENCPKKQKQVHCKVPCDSTASDCVYKKPSNWNDQELVCDPVTNKYALTLKLQKGNSSTCPPTKVIYRECRRRQTRDASVKGVKGNKKGGEGRMGHKQKTEAPAAATTTTAATVVTKSTAECKYRKAKGPKAACDPATNTRIITKQLKKNSPASCEPTKAHTETCRAAKPNQGGRKNSARRPQ